MGSSKSKQRGVNNTRPAPVDLSAMAARIDRVKISGLQRTHDDYIQRAIRNCFTATTFAELMNEASIAKANLTELGIFKDIQVTIDVSRGAGATENGYEVSFKGTELKRITGSVGTEIGNNEGSVVTELSLPNMYGRGERFSIHGSYSNAKATDINLKLTKPFLHTALGYYKPEVSISLFKNTAQFPWFKYTTHDMGVLLEYSFLLPVSIQHSLQYEYAIREIGSVGRQVPFSVREHCGPRLASVLRHICSYDKRDSTVMPTRGILVKMTNELSGLGAGNVAYVKNTTHAEINMPLFAGVSAQLCGRVGILQSDKLAPKVPLSSLFTLGGAMTVRGFHMAGVGEHTDGVASGAHTFWAAGLHLWAPLPFNRHFGSFAELFRMHAFTTLGNVDSWTMDECRASVGAGLAFRIGERARIELNYCKPVWKQPSDAAQKEGFQFGIGYEFL